MSHDIVRRAPTDVELLKESTVSSAIESFMGRYGAFAEGDQALVMAEAELAFDKDKADRSQRERALVHLSDTIVAVSNAAEKGLVKNPEDAEKLTDALIYGVVSPRTAIKYLRRAGNTDLERPLSPSELAGVISLHSDISYANEKVTIATIARAADAVGVSLSGEIDEYDTDMIMASLKHYEGDTEYSTIVDDPEDGPVSVRKKVGVAGMTIVTRSAAGMNPAYADEMSVGDKRVDDFTEMSAIDDPDEKLALYDPIEER